MSKLKEKLRKVRKKQSIKVNKKRPIPKGRPQDREEVFSALRRAHAANEFIRISDIEKGERAYQLLLERLSNTKTGK